jgi:hypothetical protein
MDGASLENSKELTNDELSMLREAAGCDEDKIAYHRFWATAELVQTLCSWGIGVSAFLHACPCHPEACKMKGRRAVNMASGAWQNMVKELP